MLRYYFIFFIALVQFNHILVKSSEPPASMRLLPEDYFWYEPEELSYPYMYKVVYCEVACLNMQDLSYDTCVLPTLNEFFDTNLNWMRVFKKIPYTEGFVDSTEESAEKEFSSADYYDDIYPHKSEELSYAYKVVYCEVACLNKQDLSYDTCVLPIYKSVHIINWNWMRVFKKIPYTEGFVRHKFNENDEIQGLLRCNEEPYPNATILVIDFPEIRRNKPGRTNTSCLKIYHQINEAKLSGNPKNCSAFLEE